MAMNGESTLTPLYDAEKIHSSALACQKTGHNEEMKTVAKLLVIYTGGTIGMVTFNGVYKPLANCMVDKLKTMPIFHCVNADHVLKEEEKNEFLILQPTATDKKTIVYKVIEFDPLLDSSNMSTPQWIEIAKCIESNYYSFDGFVVLHGTDTMGYTASALSFMCENLGKPIILTGSQIPIYETRSDGRDNFLNSLIIAGNYNIPEVLICFGDKILRGNRSTKWDTGAFSAFTSLNVPPLVTLEVSIHVDWQAVFRASAIQKFSIETRLCPNVALLRLFPGITTQTANCETLDLQIYDYRFSLCNPLQSEAVSYKGKSQILRHATPDTIHFVRAFLQPPVQGVVIQTYGAGNAPNRDDLITLFRDASRWGVLMINISQCSRGDVRAEYETGLILTEAGVIQGGDMTAEAALCKLYYVLGKEEWSMDKKKKMLGRSLRGEMTVMAEQDTFISESELIDSFAKFISLNTKEEIVKVRDAIYPSLMCSAAKSNDIPALEHLRTTGGNIGADNQDGRTPLHVACRMGHINVVHYLLNHGASVHAKDCRGDTPLVDSVEAGNLDIIKLLVQAGAHLSLCKEMVAVKMCCAAAADNASTISAWLTAGADPNCQDYDLRTPLHVAVSLNHEGIVSLLLENGACIDVKDTFGFTSNSIAENLGLHGILKLFESRQKGDRPSSS